MMIVGEIFREPSAIDGTFGELVLPFIDGVFRCYTLEPPWKDNQRNISCIPQRSYSCSLYSSSKFGRRYLLSDVKDRSGILIHPGNVAGDANFDLASDSEGCIMLGLARGSLYGQRAILDSANALSLFHKVLKNEPFQLLIRGGYT